MDLPDSGAIGAVGVVTCNRAPSLVACVDSFLANCRHYDRMPEIIVADDSPPAGSEDVRSALQPFDNRRAQRIRYGGRRERSRFTEALAQESGASPDIVRFALFGDSRCPLSTGANRNALLLDTIDSLVLNVDDDTRGDVAMAPGAEDGLSFFTGYDPTEFWFFPDRTAAVSSVSFEEIDILLAHEALLGHAVAEFGGPSDSPGRVVVTLNGLVGDSGMRSPRYYLTLSGDSRLRLVSSETGYRSAFQSREVLRTVRRRTVGTGPFLMTTFFGLDNRVLVPPFFPVQRNSDGIFGLMLQKSTPHCTAFLPSVLLHAPQPRTFQPDAMWTDADGLQLADVIIGCVFGFDTDARLPDEARLIRLGGHLRWLGSLRPTEFDAYVRAQQQFRTIAFITALQSQLQAHAGLPRYWEADVTRMIDPPNPIVTGSEPRPCTLRALLNQMKSPAGIRVPLKFALMAETPFCVAASPLTRAPAMSPSPALIPDVVRNVLRVTCFIAITPSVPCHLKRRATGNMAIWRADGGSDSHSQQTDSSTECQFCANQIVVKKMAPQVGRFRNCLIGAA